MKNNTQDVVGYRISQLDRPFDLKPNQATMTDILNTHVLNVVGAFPKIQIKMLIHNSLHSGLPEIPMIPGIHTSAYMA